MHGNTAVKIEESYSLEEEIQKFGEGIFAAIGEEQPSAFNKNYWSGRIMEWSMAKPDLKVNMFRLVDVLPALRNSTAISQHVNEYLSESAAGINGFVNWGVNLKPGSIPARLSSVFVKKAVEQTAHQFIAGRDAKEALKPLKKLRKEGIAFTVDLLGEFSVSEKEALAYLGRYLDALEILGKEVHDWREGAQIVPGNPGELTPVCVSVKLTALYSQCGPLNCERSVEILSERLTRIVRKAVQVNASLYVDAEDTASNPIIYQTFKRVFGSGEFATLPYPGIVLQAYTKDSEARLHDLIEFAKRRKSPIAVRLVKGAYWDFETIMARQNGWESPLFSKKESSDANFEKLSRILIENDKHCLPAFGSHNVRSLSHACVYAGERGLSQKDFELQMLYGMAEPIAKAFAKKGYLVRMYVPLGELLPGMGYLVRRLLENTSNESFLMHTFVKDDEARELLKRPEIIG